MLHERRWTAEKIRQRLELIEPLVYRQRQILPPFRYHELPPPSPGLVEAPSAVNAAFDDSDWPTIEPYEYWARRDTNFVLRSSFSVPSGWTGPVGVYLPLGEPGSFSHPEALAYIDGTSYATCDRHHQEFLLPEQWRDGQRHVLVLHGWTGNAHRDGPMARLMMGICEVVQIDQPTRDFIASARVALGVANVLDDNEPARGLLYNALDDAFKALDVREPFGDSFYASVGPASDILKAGIEKAGPPLGVQLSATGHAHIDVAWLWTLGQTRRKAGRTFHTVLRLMEQFPDYHFNQSSPQLYDYIRQDYPEVFEGIKERVADGRWEAIGGMWLEADCNISGSESLARQFVLGRAFFREHFGPDTDSPVLWLPDVFGYAWSLPQLIKEAGLEYFFTIKIGWNQYNRLPYDSFWWQGLDGTRVLTHFSTSNPPGRQGGNYNSPATPQDVHGSWINFQQKETQQDILMSFGYGDGGGGPTREMLENIREMATFPATPQVRNRKVIDFFRDLEAASGDQLPVWNGELYLELHRGTYTTQSRNKRANRKSEFLLHDAELLAVMAGLLDSSYEYPHEALTEAWQLVCLNQFHDIIPGSSINQVYVESLEQYDTIRRLGESVCETALGVIAARQGGDVFVVNPTGFSRDDLVLWSEQLDSTRFLRRADGQPLLTQHTAEGTLIAPTDLPPFSITPLTIASGEVTARDTGLSVSRSHLENKHLRVELNVAGDITRIYDKDAQRDVLPEGAIANQLQVFEDRPKNWDAWDIDIFYDDKMWTAEPAESIEVVAHGPLLAVLEIKRRILNSSYTQRLMLAFNSRRLDFDTQIDWQERHVLLKVAFPVEVLSPVASFEVQWGNVQRPTHQNTSWDWARFETCAQKWVDLSEGGYGVSLLNDSKYGHDIQGQVIRLSLLRSPTHPDPEADQGEHRFAYSLLPHAGAWDETTVAAAYAFNDALIAHAVVQDAEGEAMDCSGGLLYVDQPNIVVETVKQAEDGSGIIVRLYENQRKRGPVKLHTAFKLQAAHRTNLLEEQQAELTLDGDQTVRLDVRPFEIVTLRLLPQ